ncbi:hypothetical protein HDU82_004755 [Entophlyctis luteolus]|nr:hypothetical protein HDU82_004755 [Entophlyctis luteolus]
MALDSGSGTRSTQNNIDPVQLAASVRKFLRDSDSRGAWMQYKQLFAASRTFLSQGIQLNPMRLLQAEDHAKMLATLVQHIHPSVAVGSAESVVENMYRANYPLDIRDYNNMMLIYYRNGDVNSVVETFDAIMDARAPPLRGKLSKPIRPVPLDVSPRQKVVNPLRPNARTFQILMTAYSSAGLVHETKDAFEKFKSLYPMAIFDAVAHSSIISSYAALPHLRGASSLESVHAALDEFHKLNPSSDRRVLDAAVHAIGVCGDPGAAEGMFEGYAGMYGVMTYSLESVDALMAVYEVHGEVGKAETLFSRFFPSLASPPRSTAKAQHNTFGMPLAATFKSLMRMNRSAGNSARVQELFEQYQRTQVVDGEGHEILLRTLLASGELAAAKRVFEHMIERGHKIRPELLQTMDAVRAAERDREGMRSR